MADGVRCKTCHKKLAESLDGTLLIWCPKCKSMKVITHQSQVVSA